MSLALSPTKACAILARLQDAKMISWIWGCVCLYSAMGIFQSGFCQFTDCVKLVTKAIYGHFERCSTRIFQSPCKNTYSRPRGIDTDRLAENPRPPPWYFQGPCSILPPSQPPFFALVLRVKDTFVSAFWDQ